MLTVSRRAGPAPDPRAVSRLPAPVPAGSPGGLPAALVQLLRAEARAELASELATAEVQRLQRELDYAIATAKRAAGEATAARKRRQAEIAALGEG